MAVEKALHPGRIKPSLHTRIFGRRIYYLPEVTSVNDIATELARLGEEEGTMVISDFQTGGRGRLKKSWESPAEKNLLFSLILRPDAVSMALLPLTLSFSVVIAEVLESFLRVKVEVKWPNDVVASGKKICGILAEGSSREGKACYVIAGMGINVNMESSDFSPPLREVSVSCCILKGKTVARIAVLAALLADLENAYFRFLEKGFPAFMHVYNEKLAIRGREVTFHLSGRRKKGQVAGVQEEGALVVHLPGGEKVLLVNEEITLTE